MKITKDDWYAIRHSGQIFTAPPQDTDWDYYLDMQTDYEEIKKELMKFPMLREPIRLGGGIRILRQPFERVVISFIISACNNIPRISKTVAQIDFGKLDRYTEADFKRMGCGYRAPYLVNTIKKLKLLDVGELAKLDNQHLRKELMKLDGVGRKVADCIMLFCGDFHRLDVAPVDTWIKRAVDYIPTDHPYAGVAQQYVFYYLQYLKKEIK